jgi:glycosyltransferase involved in cell wall biosynthesis
MRRIKVLYVNTDLTRGAGGDMHPLALARDLDRSRFDFAVCVIEAASASFKSEMAKAGRALYSLSLSRRFYRPWNLVRIIWRLRRLFAELCPDIVQTQALHANLLARPAALLAGVPVIVSTENSLPDIERNALRRLLNMPLHGINRLLDRGTQRIVVVSELVRRWKDPRGKSGKIRVIPPPFDLAALAAPRHPPQRNRGGPVLGVVGRLSREKGHRFLIAAMPGILAQEPRTQLLIVGVGPLEAELRAQVAALALTDRVHFLGYLQDVGSIFARIDILVVPSLSDAFPLVTLEGMMMEVPVVGARTGGIAESIVDGETGLLVRPGDSAALAAACRYLLSHPDVGRQMGRRGRQRVLSDFHPSRFIARHEELYASALAATPCSRRA